MDSFLEVDSSCGGPVDSSGGSLDILYQIVILSKGGLHGM